MSKNLYDGWANVYDLIYADVKDDIPLYLEYAQKNPSPILEIACGTGRVLIPLAKAGHEVWGIDSSLTMLSMAEHKIETLPKTVKTRIHLIQGDMKDLSLGRQFSLVLIPFRSFLHLLTVEEQIRTLKNIHGLLQNNGTLIIDIFAPRHDYLAHDRRRVTNERVNPDTKHVLLRTEETSYDHTNQLIDIAYRFEEYDDRRNLIRTFHQSLKLRYIFRYEMEHLLTLSGFKLETVYGTFDKKPYDYKLGEMIFISTKAR